MKKHAIVIGVIGLSVGAVGGCQSSSGNAGFARSGPSDDRSALRQRATMLWQAKVNEDWAQVFELQDPTSRSGWDKTEFVSWSQENEPFMIKAFKFGDVQATDDMGWVEVNYNTAIRKFAQLPPRDATLWEKWRRVDGTWHPVPLRELVSYPEPPARRNASEESRLRRRFQQSWDARRAGDNHALYQFVDPHDQPKMPEVAFVDMQSLLDYRTCDLKWVEVVGELGRVHVVYTRKVTDPSLTKLPVETVAETEDWIKVNGEWYRDLSRASGATPGESE